MGTRGLYGFYKDGITKSVYNQYDTYPDGLGIEMLNLIKQIQSFDELRKIFDKLKIVKEGRKPGKRQLEHALSIITPDLDVSTQSMNDWYCILRKAQNNPMIYTNGLKLILDATEFIKDSLFCEWAYIINLDNNTLEVYKGFNKEYQEDNRYMVEKADDNGYYPCKLISVFKLKVLKIIDEKIFIKEINAAAGGEEE
ncbi:MAG TPA: hypothetical protein PKL04_00710 [Methanofastidiosum sp.]|nr:hypothetical protein [Methanofastidiosum sp.]